MLRFGLTDGSVLRWRVRLNPTSFHAIQLGVRQHIGCRERDEPNTSVQTTRQTHRFDEVRCKRPGCRILSVELQADVICKERDSDLSAGSTRFLPPPSLAQFSATCAASTSRLHQWTGTCPS